MKIKTAVILSFAFVFMSCSKSASTSNDDTATAGDTSTTEGKDTVTSDSSTDKIDSEIVDSDTEDSTDSSTDVIKPPLDNKLTGKEVVPKINWIKIEKGTFTFGSPADTPCSSYAETEFQVTLTHSFLIAETEVTQSQWTSLDYLNPSIVNGSDIPVSCVNYYEALAWCNKLSKFVTVQLEICIQNFEVV